MYISSKGIRISAKPSAAISLLTGLLGGSRIYKYKNHCFKKMPKQDARFFLNPKSSRPFLSIPLQVAQLIIHNKVNFVTGILMDFIPFLVGALI